MSEFDPDKSDMENLCMAIYALARAVDGIGLNLSDPKQRPGTLEFIGMELRDTIGPALQGISMALEKDD